MNIKVHHARRSRSVRIIWLLEELGIPYELASVEFHPDSLRSSEHLRLHPLGQVPVVELDGTLMIESGAIVEYLLEHYDATAQLAPQRESAQRAEYLQWFHFGEATLARHAGELIRHQYGLPEAERVPGAVEYARRRFRGAAGLIDGLLAERDYILGRDFSAADIMLSYGITTTKIAHELPADLIHVAAYLRRLKERPAYQVAWT